MRARSKVYEAVLHPANGGGGEYDWTERVRVQGAATERGWARMARRGHPGATVAVDEDADGAIHNQNAVFGNYLVMGTPYRITGPHGGSSLHLVWEV